MSPANAPEPSLLVEAEILDERACTRCDGTQHLTAHEQGMGSYRCDDCAMAVGFDLDASPAEFLLSRGMPSRYTKTHFGDRILPLERRLQTRA